MELVIDACTAILLAKATVLETASRSYELSFTEDVFGEVTEGRHKMFHDALLVERLNNEKRISIMKTNSTLKEKLMKSFNMAEGEASTIAAGIEKKCAIATDNKQGRKAAIISNLPLAGSVEIVVSLYKKGKIDHNKARASLKTLQEEGWFDSYLIEKAMEDLK